MKRSSDKDIESSEVKHPRKSTYLGTMNEVASPPLYATSSELQELRREFLLSRGIEDPLLTIPLSTMMSFSSIERIDSVGDAVVRLGVPKFPYHKVDTCPPSIFLKGAQDGDILLFSGNHGVSLKIRFVTRSVYSHAGILFKNGTKIALFHAADPNKGVIVAEALEVIKNYHPKDEPNDPVVWRKLTGPNKRERQNISNTLENIVNKHKGADFTLNMLDVIRGWLGYEKSNSTKGSWFCSELVAFCLIESGIIESKVKKPHSYSPHDLSSENTIKNFHEGWKYGTQYRVLPKEEELPATLAFAMSTIPKNIFRKEIEEVFIREFGKEKFNLYFPNKQKLFDEVEEVVTNHEKQLKDTQFTTFNRNRCVCGIATNINRGIAVAGAVKAFDSLSPGVVPFLMEVFGLSEQLATLAVAIIKSGGKGVTVALMFHKC